MNILKQFIKSLYSPTAISTFRFQKIGRGIFYIFFIMFITILPNMIILGINFSEFFEETTNHLTNTLPEFSVEDGVLMSNIDEPMINEKEGGTIIFDPTGEITSNDIVEYNPALALLKNEAVIFFDGVRESFPYEQSDFTRDDIASLFESIHGVTPLLVGLFFIVTYFLATGMKFIGVTVLSALAYLLNKKIGNTNYKQSWLLAAYTITLPTVIFAILDLFQITIPFSFAIYWLISIIMLYNVIQVIHAKKVKN